MVTPQLISPHSSFTSSSRQPYLFIIHLITSSILIIHLICSSSTNFLLIIYLISSLLSTWSQHYPPHHFPIIHHISLPPHYPHTLLIIYIISPTFSSVSCTSFPPHHLPNAHLIIDHISHHSTHFFFIIHLIFNLLSPHYPPHLLLISSSLSTWAHDLLISSLSPSCSHHYPHHFPILQIFFSTLITSFSPPLSASCTPLPVSSSNRVLRIPQWRKSSRMLPHRCRYPSTPARPRLQQWH